MPNSLCEDRRARRRAAVFAAVLGALFAATVLAQEDDGERASKAPEIIKDGQECKHCHMRLVRQKEVHRPVADDCTNCHEQDGKRHAFTLPTKTVRDLCLDCHEMDLEGNVHQPLAGENPCGSCHEVHAGKHPKLLKANPTELCASCHEEVRPPRKRHVHGPFATGLCQACHDPHASKHEQLLHRPGQVMCLECHEDFAAEGEAKKAWHAPVQEDCSACHSGHESDHPAQTKAPQPALCLDCHDEIGEKIANAASRHKAVTEGSACGGCHTPHRSPYARLLKVPAADSCLTCHDKEYPQEKRPLPNLAKLLEEKPQHHGPVKEKSCESCHDTHASQHFRLLKEEYPAKFYAPFDEKNYAMCFGCHTSDIVREKDTKATNFRDKEKGNLHFLHINRKKGRTCRACHAVHASSEPHHLRATTPFGSWDLPVGYTKTENGGRCATGCHVEATYERGE
jgi:predicted CXXCH cytochrome family protein